MIPALLTTAILPVLALGVAVPVTKLDKRVPSFWEEERINLIARTTSSPPSPNLQVDGLSLTPIHSGAGQNVAVLLNPTTNVYNASPGYYYGNGTDAEIADRAGNILRDAGTDASQQPYGLVIYNDDNDNDQSSIPSTVAPRPLMINIGAGTPDISIAGVSGSEGRPFLNVNRWQGSQTSVSQFIACEATFFGEMVPQVLWRHQGEATPDGCVEIALLPQCAGNVTITGGLEYVQNSPCFPDATHA